MGFSLFGLQEDACGIGKGDEQWNCKVVGLFIFKALAESMKSFCRKEKGKCLLPLT